MKKAKITSRIIKMSADANYVHGILSPQLMRTPRAMRMNAERQITKHMEKCDRQRDKGYAKGLRTPRVTHSQKITSSDLTFLKACGIAY